MPFTEEQLEAEKRRRTLVAEKERRKTATPDFGLFVRPKDKLPGVWNYNKDLANLLSGDIDIEATIPWDVKNDFGRIIGMTEKPDETKNKLATSLFYSVQFDQPPKVTYNLLDELNKIATGGKVTPSSAWARIKQRYQGGKNSVKIMDSSFGLMKDVWKADSWESFDKALKDIEKIQSSIPVDVQKEFRREWEKILGASAEQLPIMFEALKVAPAGALFGGLAFGIGAALTTAAIPTIGEEAVVPLATMSGIKWGAGIRGAVRVGELEAGGMFLELTNMKDKYGNRIDPRYAVVASYAVGSINGAIEMVEWQLLLSTFGIGQRVFDKSVAKVTQRLFAKGTLKEILTRKIAQYGIVLSGEILQEVEQETSNIVFAELAKELNNARRGTKFKPITVEDLQKRYNEVLAESARAMGVLAAPGTILTTMMETLGREKAPIEEAKLGVEEVKIEEAPVEVSAEKRQESIDYVRGVIESDKYTKLDEETRLQIGVDMLAEFGVEVEAEELIEAPTAKPEAIGVAPEVVYHGTTSEAAQAIKKKGFKPEIINGQYFGSGVYLALTKSEASKYGEEVLSIKPNLKNPFVLDLDKYGSVEEWYAEIQPEVAFPLTDEYGEAITVHTIDLDVEELYSIKPEATEASEAIAGYLQEKGYDGVIVKQGGKDVEIVVFDPKQVELSKPEVAEKPTPPVEVEFTEQEKALLEHEATQEIEPNLYIGNVTQGMKRRISEGIGAATEDIKGFLEGAFPTKRTKIKTTVGEAEAYLEWLMDDLQQRLNDNLVRTENQLAWANADWGDIVALREVLGLEKDKRPFSVVRAQKNVMITIKGVRERIWATIKPGSLQESKMTVGEVLSAVIRKVAKETKLAFAAGRRELRAEIRAKKRAKARVDEALKTVQQKIPTSVDFFYREAIEALRTGFDLAQRSKKAVWQMEQTREFLKQKPEKIKDMPTKLMKKVLQKPLNDMTIEDLEEVGEEVTKLKEQGKLKQSLKLKQEAKELNAQKQEMVSNLSEGETIEGEEQPVVFSTTKEGAIDTTVRKTQAWTFRPPRLFDLLDGMKRFRGAIHQFFIDRVNEQTDAKLRMEDKRKNAGLEKLRELGLSLSALAQTRIVDGITYNINEMIAIYNFNKNHLSRLALLWGNNFTKEEIRSIIVNLSEAEKAWGDWIVSDFEQRYSALRRAVVKAENRDPGYQENYTPMRRQDIDYKTQTDEIIESLLRRQSLQKAYAEKGATLTRKDVPAKFQNPIKLDATGVWLDQLNKQEHYIHFASLLKEMHKMVDDKTFKAAVKRKAGKSFNYVIKQYVNRVANPNIWKSYSDLENLSRTLRQRTAVAYLAYNLLTMAKQLPSLLLYLPHTGFTHLLSSAMEFSAHPMILIDKVRNLDPQVKHRSVEREFEELKHQKPQVYNRMLSKFGRAGMEGIFLFDTVARTIGWNAVYQKALSMGWSEVEAIRHAQSITLRTQPAAAAKDLAQVYTTNEFFNWFTMFTNQLNQIYNITVYDIHAAWKNKDYAEAGLTIFAEGLVALSIWGIANKSIPDDKEKFVDALTEQFLNTLPVVGKMLMTGKRGWGSDAPPVFKLPRALGAALKKLQAGKELNDSEKLAVAEGLAVLSGVPYTGVKRAVDVLAEGDITKIVGRKPKD